MKDLIREIGIKDDNIPFFNTADLQASKDAFIIPSDRNWGYLMNSYLTQLDMTDYEDAFTGFNELGGDLPINRHSWLAPYQEEPWPQSDKLALVEERESKPIIGTTST